MGEWTNNKHNISYSSTGPVLDDVMLRTVLKMHVKRVEVIEQRLRLVLRPKPWWMPRWLHHRLVAMLVERHESLPRWLTLPT